MVQTKLNLRSIPKKAIAHDSNSDVVMSEDNGIAGSSSRTRRVTRKKALVIDSDGDEEEDPTNRVSDPEVSTVTQKTKMLMVAVEVPTRQAKLDTYFAKSPVVRSSSKTSASTSKTGGSRKKKLNVHDEEEYVPEVYSADESLPDDELAEEDEASDAVLEAFLEEDEKPDRKGKSKVASQSTTKDGKKKKESYKCQSIECGLKIEVRDGEKSSGLAPIHSLPTIFGDIIDRILPHVSGLMGKRRLRKLRVATMCSGTESPLLAMEMFSKAIKERGLGNLEIEHVFSCEIEPYKQAYIERNFKPPVLFRDIKELGAGVATTAYGALVPVPEDVDILIAGTSCVDFSNLNNKQKGINEGGESGDTFLGMMAWVAKHRPLIVIQENVCNAAWAEMRHYYRDRGYAAEYARFNTRDYYLPHTRQRGYLCAVNLGKDSDIPKKWINACKKMVRPCTTTLEAFMLADDDPRVYKARMELAGDPRRTGPIKARTVDWEKCEGRHQRERIEKKLGEQRPVTAWQEGGVCKTLDFMWQDWGRKQVERVLDLMDINFLLSVKSGYDPMYKAAFWNLSQNVDRNTMGGKPEGICPCLTPHMIAYLCYRGGPMTGVESLHLQGLPIDELLLTRESSAQIQDLAGNAMSSTVVGTAVMMALVLSQDHLPDRTEDDAMDVDETDVRIESNITGDEDLTRRPLDLSTTVSLDLNELLLQAGRSSRLCICEGRLSITENKIRLCTECEFTACDKCGGRPPHVVPENQSQTAFENRIPPLEFESKLKSILPMRIQLSGINISTLEELRTKEGAFTNLLKDWKIWTQIAQGAVDGEFRFKSLIRQENWIANYDAPAARLELILNPKKPEWRMFGKCPELEGVRSRKRALCVPQIARMIIEPGKGVLTGQWEFSLPVSTEIQSSVEGILEKVPSWKRSLGYTDSETMRSEVWNHLRVTVPQDDKSKLDRDVSGVYRLLPNCGTAQGALHVRVENPDGQPPIYLFLDQMRTGDASHDSFIFSESHRRLGYGEVRSTIAKLDPSWRQSAKDGPENVTINVQGQWVAVEAEFGPPLSGSSKDGIVSVPNSEGLTIDCSINGCKAAHAILKCEVPFLGDQAEEVWPIGKWVEVDDIHERLTFESLAWLTERVRSLEQLSEWSTLDRPQAGLTNCERCAPTPPQLKWFFIKNTFKAIEDPQEAAPYERALKARPRPFVTQMKLNEDGMGTLKIGLNIPTLVHRALSRLPSHGRDCEPVLSWRLVTDYIPQPRLLLPHYKLTSNKADKESVQPPNFIQKLRREQLRSLSWMKDQERKNIGPFIEEEVAESLLPHLNWRAEGKATRLHYVRGGVLADEVGYGKTAITIGLIDSTQSDIKLPEKIPGAIPVRATLVVVPNHLSKQWVAEITKFTGNKYKVQEINDQTAMNKISAKDIMTADIIVVNAGLFHSPRYLGNLAQFACARPAPGAQGRRFFDWQKSALEELAKQVDHLLEWGVASVRKRIDEAASLLDRQEAQDIFIQKKRLVGSAYVESKGRTGEKRRRSMEENKSGEEVEDESEDSGSGSDRAKKARITKVDKDPWRLRSQLVEKDWTRMLTPPFEMFHFNRLVVDEFTYLNGQIHAGITSQRSNSRWVLSGTPPMEDFADVKTIAVYLDVHLGIDDDEVGTHQNRKKMRKDLTEVELFTAFKQTHSPHWHTRRYEVAQAFLDKYIRQNYAEIDEILFEEHIVPISLPAAERAIYLELEHYLQALDYNIKKKSKAKVDNDRDRRQQEALGDSQTAEEALIKRCSHFDLDDSRRDEENAVQACDVIVEDRKKQLHSCREDIRRSLKDAFIRYNEIPSREWQEGNNLNDKRPKNLFSEFITQCRSSGVGDPDANHDIQVLLDEAEHTAKKCSGTFRVIYSDSSVADPKISLPPPPTIALSKGKGKKKAKAFKEPTPEVFPVDDFERMTQLKAKVMYLRGLVRKELAGRHRSLRYFTVVRDLQTAQIKKSGAADITCPGCSKKIKESDIAVLSSCGHQGCYDCLERAARETRCLTDGCAAATRALAVVRADTLGSEDKRDGIGRHHGKKLEKMVELIQDRIPHDEKILLFVQFPDLLEKVAQLLAESHISYLRIEGGARKKSTTVADFQQATGEKGPRVMLLNITAESASGSNFTNSNHVIILSPLLAETEYQYVASETQAIGRVRRYGQTKTVHIWRFMSEDTMDVEVYEKRTGEIRTSEQFKSKIYEL